MYDRIKGFRDLYPPDMAPHRAVIEQIEGVARRYGFREIGTPALEHTELYIDKSGPEIVDELYAFTDQGGRDVALTPELTPTVARMVVAKHQALRKPIKWYSTRPFWRYEQVQQGRFREFYQTNVDIFGSAEPAADAEILAFAADALLELDLTPDDFVFRVSHRDILGALLEAIEPSVNIQEAIRTVDKRDGLDEVVYFEQLEAAGLSASQAQQFDDTLTAASTDLTVLTGVADSARMGSAVENLQAVMDAVAAFGAQDCCEISLETARGLDYYTGVVFECFDTAGEVNRAIFGGGRYDDLIEGFGGPSTPAVGVAPGVVNSTLPLLLQRAGVWPAGANELEYYILSVGDTFSEAIRIAQELRTGGHRVETDLANRGFGAQLDYADTRGAHTVVIVGERDLAEGNVTIKDMATGNQVAIPVDEFPGAVVEPRYEDFANGG